MIKEADVEENVRERKGNLIIPKHPRWVYE